MASTSEPEQVAIVNLRLVPTSYRDSETINACDLTMFDDAILGTYPTRFSAETALAELPEGLRLQCALRTII